MATITEALWFSGRLRLPEEIPDSRVHSFVQEVMQLVELTSLAHAIIGTPAPASLAWLF